MQIYTYNLFDPIPENINNSKPVCLFFQGEEQDQKQFKRHNNWTNLLRIVCLYLYENPITHDSFINILKQKYSFIDIAKHKYQNSSSIVITEKENNSNRIYHDITKSISINSLNAQNVIFNTRYILDYCKVDLHFIDVIYLNKNEDPKNFSFEISQKTQAIKNKQVIYTSSFSQKESSSSNLTSFTASNSIQNEDLNIAEKIQEAEESSQDSQDFSNGKAEGSRIEYFASRIERNPQNRKKAIEKHGTQCFACDFKFEEKYGPFGKDFIEIHHKYPLAEQESEIVINPDTDLIPLCANCHRMIHHRNPCLSLEELKELINKNKKENEDKNK